MKINKVLILGIDALEYELVEKWDLKNLKQEEYGKVELPTKKEDGFFYELPTTLIMWTSFITGKIPKEHQVQTFKLWNKKWLNWLETHLFVKLLKPIQFDHRKLTKREKQQHLFNKLKSILEPFGYKKEEPSRKDIRSTTIFDLPQSIHLHIPVYDKDAFPIYKKKIIYAIENKAYRPIFEFQCMQEFNERTKEVCEWLNKDWKLFMQYFYVLDGIQHVFYNQPKKIAKFYLMFDEFVGKVREKIDNETLLLIISDHGQKNGIHTNYGFYSLNKPLGLKNPKLIDFRWIIEDLLKNNFKVMH